MRMDWLGRRKLSDQEWERTVEWQDALGKKWDSQLLRWVRYREPDPERLLALGFEWDEESEKWVNHQLRDRYRAAAQEEARRSQSRPKNVAATAAVVAGLAVFVVLGMGWVQNVDSFRPEIGDRCIDVRHGSVCQEWVSGVPPFETHDGSNAIGAAVVAAAIAALVGVGVYSLALNWPRDSL
jgi:hypothetical protein